MLQGLRKAGQSLVGKIVATILFGILIVSFAIWGIGDIFRGGPQNWVARVGGTEISADQFRTAFNNQLQRLNQQFRTRLTTEQARSFGVDRQVLGQLINDAVLNERARELGLSASDELVARTIMEQPLFRDQNGQFNRVLFENALQQSGLSEAGFVREQRASIARIHIAEAIAGALPVPAAAREAAHRFANERRAASYFVLGPAAAGAIPAPTPEQLQAFYEERKSSFRAPEYRSLNVVAVNAAALAKPETVSDAEARQRYEQQKASFGTPERRTVQQIVFPSKEEAEAAAARIKEGAPFEAVAVERGVSAQDLELGTFAKAEMLDPAVADAAFSLKPGEVSAPVEGRFGTVLVRVTDVQPGAVRPFEELVGEIKLQIARERRAGGDRAHYDARAEIDPVYNEIEDMRAGARPLADIAKEKNLPLVQVAAVDQTGRDKGGQVVQDLPEARSLLQAAFASDVGVDNEPLRTQDGGYVWFDVTGIEPPRDKPLDEVRAEVERQWRENEISQRLAEKARQLVDRLDKGEPIEALAGEVGAEAKAAADLARRSPKDELTADVVARVFATPVGKAGSASSANDSRVVFKVTAATVPPLLTTTQQAQQAEEQFRDGFADTLVAEYIAQAQSQVQVTVNQQALQTALGGGG
ncbi:MAG TPA: peptidyl-prolyl cis-trans isomerase [Microvirga sp.]|nr:peptidyl-prolyl cis-trans isomerase [Microvirga sp.]